MSDTTILKAFEGPVKLKDMLDGTKAEVVLVAEQPGQVAGVVGVPFASADASTAAAVTDAPGAGKVVKVDSLIVSSGAAISLTFKEETSGTVILGPLYFAANSTQIVKLPANAVKTATANKKLMVQASGAGNVSVLAVYRKEAA